MIIGRAEAKDGSGKQALFLGLSAGNVARLVAGDPMHLKPATHPGVPEDWEILIVYAATEQEIFDLVKEAGGIGPDTEVIHGEEGT